MPAPLIYVDTRAMLPPFISRFFAIIVFALRRVAELRLRLPRRARYAYAAPMPYAPLLRELRSALMPAHIQRARIAPGERHYGARYAVRAQDARIYAQSAAPRARRAARCSLH